MKVQSNMPDVGKLVEFEQDRLEHDEVIALFQDGVDKGWVWHLQDFYRRTAERLLAAGLIHVPEP